MWPLFLLSLDVAHFIVGYSTIKRIGVYRTIYPSFCAVASARAVGARCGEAQHACKMRLGTADYLGLIKN